MRTIATRRLAGQHIGTGRFRRPVEVVSWLGTLQGQDYLGALWSIGLRTQGCTEADIEQALDDTEIVRLWLMRGTLHIAAAADVRWMVALLGPRVIALSALRYQELELDERTLARSSELLAGALSGGRRRTRKELLALLRQNGISTEGQRAPYLLQRAVMDGLICQASARRGEPIYLEVAALPPAKPLSREESLAELARRYFRSRGPATLHDFAYWSGLLMDDARAGLEAARADLAAETIDGQTYWRGFDAPEPDAPSPSVFLLPGFDEFLLGYRDRSAVMDVERARDIPKNGMLPPNVVIDGWVCGHWKRTLRKQDVTIHCELFRPLTADEKNALEEAAEAYASFLQRRAILTLDVEERMKGD